jgi:glycosyltransferase involved in cell wall biosynthesis
LKIWIVNHYANEPGTSASGGLRHFKIGKELTKLEHEVQIFASSLEHRTNRQRLKHPETRLDQIFEGVGFRFLKSSGYSGNSLKRVANILQFALRLARKKNLEGLGKPDIIIASSPFPVAAITSYFLAKRFCVPFVYEIRDLWPQALIDLGQLKKNSSAARVLFQIEKFLVRNADGIISTLPNIKSYFQGRNIIHPPIVHIPNGHDATVEPLPNMEKSNKFVFQYFGSIGAMNNLEAILAGFALFGEKIHASDQSSTKNIPELRVYGDGPLRESLISKFGNLPNLKFLGSFRHSELQLVTSQADCHVVALAPLDVYKYGISLNKLTEYLSCDRPVLIFGKAWGNPVELAGAGVTIEELDPEAIALGMLEMFESSETQRDLWSKNGIRFVKSEFSWTKNTQKLDIYLRSLVHGYAKPSRTN